MSSVSVNPRRQWAATLHHPAGSPLDIGKHLSWLWDFPIPDRQNVPTASPHSQSFSKCPCDQLSSSICSWGKENHLFNVSFRGRRHIHSLKYDEIGQIVVSLVYSLPLCSALILHTECTSLQSVLRDTTVEKEKLIDFHIRNAKSEAYKNTWSERISYFLPALDSFSYCGKQEKKYLQMSMWLLFLRCGDFCTLAPGVCT